MNGRQKRGTLFCKLELMYYTLLMRFSCSRSDFFGILSRDKETSNCKTRADWLRRVDVLWNTHPCPNQSTKRRTKGEGAGFFFLSWLAFVLEFLKLFCVIYLSLFVLFVLARTVFLGI